MNESESYTAPPKRKMLCLPLPTHKLVSRVAALRGQSLGEALYVVFREELRRQEDGDAWALAPEPFTIKPTYTANGCEVLISHPMIPTLILTSEEAADFAQAILSAASGIHPRFRMKTETGGHVVKVARGGRCVMLTVDGDSAPMIAPTATDVADALISASGHAGPLPEGGPI